MASRRFPIVLALAYALASPASATAVPSHTPWHARLLRSQPATHDTLTKSPSSIRLWFSEPVEIAVSRIRLAGPSGEPVALGRATHIANEGAAMMATVERPLKPGTYWVRWTSAAQDGHALKGEFSFVIVPGK